MSRKLHARLARMEAAIIPDPDQAPGLPIAWEYNGPWLVRPRITDEGGFWPWLAGLFTDGFMTWQGGEISRAVKYNHDKCKQSEYHENGWAPALCAARIILEGILTTVKECAEEGQPWALDLLPLPKNSAEMVDWLADE